MSDAFNRQKFLNYLKVFLALTAVLVFFQGIFFLTPGTAGQIRVLVNGESINSADMLVENGHALVSCRVIAENLGAAVKWNTAARTATVTRKQDSVQFTPGSATAFKNGKRINLAVYAKIVRGRLYVPLKATAESLGGKVVWDKPRSTVIVDNGYCPVCVSLKK